MLLLKLTLTDTFTGPDADTDTDTGTDTNLNKIPRIWNLSGIKLDIFKPLSLSFSRCQWQDSNPQSGITKGGSITVPLTSCLTGLG
jgi:hypothetical protein